MPPRITNIVLMKTKTRKRELSAGKNEYNKNQQIQNKRTITNTGMTSEGLGLGAAMQ